MSTQKKASVTTSEVDLQHELSKGFAHRYIRFRCRRMIGRAGLIPADLPDLVQEVKLHLIQRFPQFDPGVQCWRAFVVANVRRLVCTMLQSRRRRKRDQSGREMSLSEVVSSEAGQPLELGDLLSNDDGTRHRRHYARTATESFELEQDVPAAIALLTPQQQQLCELVQSCSAREAARRLGLPHETVVYMLQQLRPILAKAGLHLFRTDRGVRADYECDLDGNDESKKVTD